MLNQQMHLSFKL